MKIIGVQNGVQFTVKEKLRTEKAEDLSLPVTTVTIARRRF